MSADCEKIGDCEDARIQRLYEYLDGALTHEDLEEVRSHLEECTECAHEYDLECIIRSVVRRSCRESAPDGSGPPSLRIDTSANACRAGR